MKVPLLDLKAQYSGSMRDEIRQAIDEVCDSQYFILGPRVQEFENNTAEYCGTQHAVGVSSGTDALIIALMALGIGPGDAVITSPYSFFATVGSIIRVGATPVFADIDPVSYNIDPAGVRKLLDSFHAKYPELTPRVLLPVHLYGQSADMGPLLEIATEFDLKIVEDAAQAIGVEYKLNGNVVKAGSMGDIGCFSFFPSKNLGGFGDGGMVTTNDADLAEKMRQLRNHGAEPRYYHKFVGGNFRLDALQAVVLDIKLRRLESWHGERRKNAEFYDGLLKETAVSVPYRVYRDQGFTNYHIFNQYVVRVPNRDSVWASMKEAGVGCEVYYPVPLHMQECFSGLGYEKGDMPESEKAAMETLALPIYPELTEEMQDYVVKTMLSSL
jgi:dTDP-4-amino-4,6-dideoxygalactose transaminase